MEGLGEVVVGAEPEACDAVGGVAGGGEHQDHRGLFAVGDDLAEPVAVDTGEVAVEKDDVVGVEVDLRDSFEAVVGDVDGHALIAQALGDPVGVAGHVLDDKDPHLMVPASCGIAAARVI